MRSLTLASVFLAAATAHASQQDYPFKLVNRADAGRQIIMAQNSGPAPVRLHLSLTPDNAITNPASPIDVVIKPGESAAVATIEGKTPGRRYRVARSYKFSIGDPNAVPSSGATYRLPFMDGQTSSVGQAPGGKVTTHTGPDSRYAIDFIVPTGTPVLAARKGIVVDIDQGYTEGGNDIRLKANHVLILHEDGTLALYSHLSSDSHAVSFGQTVDAGTLIGYSGNTGYLTGPHLHFAVLTNTRSDDGTARYLSHPVKFVDFAPPQEISLFQGESMAVNHSAPPLAAFKGRNTQVQHPTGR